MHNLVSFVGIFVLMGVAWLLSTDRRVINWRVVLWGTALQLLFALFIFVIPAGSKAFLFVNDAVVRVLDSASAGTRFVFGRLAIPPGSRGDSGEESLGFILAFQALPTIIFFASLMSALYYAGIMPRIIRVFSNLFTRMMRISGAESLSVSSNIFVGVEANMTVLPHLGAMTRSEFCTILAALLAANALHSPRSAVIAAYALCGFAHIASLAIFIGGTAALVPDRTKDLSGIGPRAFAAATLSCLMTAAVAGTFYTGSSLLFGK